MELKNQGQLAHELKMMLRNKIEHTERGRQSSTSALLGLSSSVSTAATPNRLSFLENLRMKGSVCDGAVVNGGQQQHPPDQLMQAKVFQHERNSSYQIKIVPESNPAFMDLLKAKNNRCLK